MNQKERTRNSFWGKDLEIHKKLDHMELFSAAGLHWMQVELERSNGRISVIPPDYSSEMAKYMKA